jgi:hypothetical protein
MSSPQIESRFVPARSSEQGECNPLQRSCYNNCTIQARYGSGDDDTCLVGWRWRADAVLSTPFISVMRALLLENWGKRHEMVRNGWKWVEINGEPW